MKRILKYLSEHAEGIALGMILGIMATVLLFVLAAGLYIALWKR